MSTSRVIAKVQARVRRGWTDTEWELRHLGLEEMGEYLTNKLGWTETQADMALKKLRMPVPWKLDREAGSGETGRSCRARGWCWWSAQRSNGRCGRSGRSSARSSSIRQTWWAGRSRGRTSRPTSCSLKGIVYNSLCGQLEGHAAGEQGLASPVDAATSIRERGSWEVGSAFGFQGGAKGPCKGSGDSGPRPLKSQAAGDRTQAEEQSVTASLGFRGH